MGWLKNVQDYYEHTKSDLEKVMRKIKKAHLEGQLLKFRDIMDND